jgi:hypothetical protein
MSPFDWEVDPDRYLYHYTTREAALGSILPLGRLRLGLLRETNDPRESSDWQFTLYSAPGTGVDIGDDANRIHNQMPSLIKSATKVLCLSRDDPDPVPPYEMFARGFSHSRMWAQYAGGHSGVCLVFDRQYLGRAIDDQLTDHGVIYQGAVTYADRRSDDLPAFGMHWEDVQELPSDELVTRHVALHHDALFFRKSLDWETEWEYRWILVNDVPAPAYFEFGDALCGIVVGASFPESADASLGYQAERLGGLGTRMCVWRNGRPSIVPIPAGRLGSASGNPISPPAPPRLVQTSVDTRLPEEPQ